MVDREYIELMALGVIGFIGMEFLNELSTIAGIIFGLGILIFAMLNYLFGQKRRKEEKAQAKRSEEKHEWERKEHELRMKNMREGQGPPIDPPPITEV